MLFDPITDGAQVAQTRALSPAPPALAQSTLYADALGAVGAQILTLPLEEEVGRATLILRQMPVIGRVALLPGGPWWATPDLGPPHKQAALRPLFAQAHAMGIRALISNPADHADGQVLRRLGGLPLLTPQTEARLDLSPPDDARRKQLHGKWRNRLTRGEAAGLTITEDSFAPKRHLWILELEAAQRKSHGYRALPLDVLMAAAAQAPHQVRVFTARRRGRALAAMVFLLHEGAATYHIAVQRPEARTTGAHNLLLWQASCALKQAGIQRLDLGPVETERDTGLARFKLGTGAALHQRGPTLLHCRATAPLGRLAAWVSRTGARAAEARNDPSCR
ncbi:GNAT family N-acetyltransferase [Rhodalgimonas zhirmunskyi]|uniref:GNAT family N-acetyltransferase n=1 Tax=Rhodalgimonas zhirmunskyi TaxID=2964767 RepID=A0AAJ1U9P9_9RHOB|nr:GNAT family N-acetyltransferase [Rhodoalgimonas zhirmunskyi]MDQ2092576.1 GNAT family N-acetyltransferase [Rhodoalgimonas zhirmunskyi]